MTMSYWRRGQGKSGERIRGERAKEVAGVADGGGVWRGCVADGGAERLAMWLTATVCGEGALLMVGRAGWPH